NGRDLQIVSANTKSKPELAGNAATKVIDEGADIVIVSCDFDQGSPAAIVAQQAGKLTFSTCAASTDFGPSGIGPLAFTMATAAPVEGAAMAEWAYNDKGLKSAYTLLDDTLEFTKQTTESFTTRWEELGGDIAGASTFKQGDASIASQINEIKALPEAPDAIWLASYNPGAASALKQIRAAGLDMPILGDEDLDGDYWKEAVPNISDVYYATYASLYGDDSDQKINDLLDRYKEQEGKLPDTSLFLTGYAAVEAIAKAVEGADGSTEGTDPQAQLETFDDEQLLLPTTFTSENHISFKRTLRIMEIQNGKTKLVTEFSPESVPGSDG
ncbi:MAG: ABC transporter substrate-binding protein, partial [Actinomycetota bacterium]|nr:ABC transporter substrate-binding protein [Actinomycetota bacterium]